MAARVNHLGKPRRASLAICSLLLSGVLAMHASDAPLTVGWGQLQTLDTTRPLAQQQNIPAQKLNGKVVSIPGFMVPLEDDLEQVTEFLLVPYAGACIHVPPPPPNQMVYVKMNSANKVHVTFTDPIMVTGQLRITTVVSPYGDVSYNMVGTTVKPYQP